MDESDNINVVMDFFRQIDTNNVSDFKSAECSVDYKTDNNEYSFYGNYNVNVNTGNRDYYSVSIDGINVNKYHTEFRTNYQNFKFNGKSLIINGVAMGKNFNKYKIEITPISNV